MKSICKSKNIKKRRRLPHGIYLCLYCRATSFDGHIYEVADTKSELIFLMKERNFDRSDYEVEWVAIETDKEGVERYNDGVGNTKKEAIDDFWNNYTGD